MNILGYFPHRYRVMGSYQDEAIPFESRPVFRAEATAWRRKPPTDDKALGLLVRHMPYGFTGRINYLGTTRL